MDILIINPGSVEKKFQTEHIGIASLKSWLIKEGFAADILDTSIEELSSRETVRRILALNPPLLGLSLLDDTKEKGLAIIREAVKSGYRGRIIAGGYFATFAAHELLRDFPEIDFIVRGEGEITLSELCKTLLGRSETGLQYIAGISYRELGAIVQNPARELIRDLDILPPPDRKYAGRISSQSSHIRIYASRGCWGQCSFCDIHNFYRSSPGANWRRRSITHLVDEIEEVMKVYGQDYFIFNDDQFLSRGRSSRTYVQDFAAELRRRNLNIRFELMCRADTIDHETMQMLKEAGLQRVFLGIESFNKAQLERFRKNISVRRNIKALITLFKLRINVITSVILADAYTTLKELIEHFYVLYRLRKRYFTSSDCRISVNKQVDVYRGSDIYRDYKSNGLLTTDNYLDGYHYRLKFGTRLRLRLLSLEEKISTLFS